MRRLVIVMGAMLLLAGAVYAARGEWAIRHDTLDLFDAARKRPVAVDITVRRDVEIRAAAGLLTMPVAVISHGYTIKASEYSFLADLLAQRGYLVASIQHDLPGDAPLSQSGPLYVGRMPMYERGLANILFVIGELKKRAPHAAYGGLTLLGHSNGGDISMVFAGRYPGMVAKVVTLDNLRVPFLMDGRQKILSFRSGDWKPDPGVVPGEALCKAAGIELVMTGTPHALMSDRGSAAMKRQIAGALESFLDRVAATPAAMAGPAPIRSASMYTPISP